MSSTEMPEANFNADEKMELKSNADRGRGAEAELFP